jgi:hypothetical protein
MLNIVLDAIKALLQTYEKLSSGFRSWWIFKFFINLSDFSDLGWLMLHFYDHRCYVILYFHLTYKFIQEVKN